MKAFNRSLLDLKTVAGEELVFTMEDYASQSVPRWCAGCGDHAIFTAVQRLLESEQLRPEDCVFVSGIGCSGRFPHYVGTYGFHGIHGRAIPICTGIRLARPDLNVFAVMGDGDCCAIGTGHWIHAIRYNCDMVATVLDNNIYALTKKQTSPTTRMGKTSNTDPDGAKLPALDPLSVVLGVTNCSFVAQTADWIPGHLYATLKAAYHHKGFSFVRILQRCPNFTNEVFLEAVQHPEKNVILRHENGISDPDVEEYYTNHMYHDPSNLDAARALTHDPDKIRLGLYYADPSRPCYDELRRVHSRTAQEKFDLLNKELDRYAV